MVTVLGCRKSRPTGTMLANNLNAAYTENRVQQNETVIRFGNSFSPEGTGSVINKMNAIRKSSNKPLCKQLLLDAGIKTPALYSFEEANQLLRTHRVPEVIVRKNGHSQGRWFYRINDPRHLARYDPASHYCQEMVEKIDEYRLFVMNNRIIEADLKEMPADNPNGMIRNHTHGSYFRWVRVSSLDPIMKSMVRKAVSEVVGLDFAAVDCATIRLPSGNISSTIFEINSAPSLNERKLDLFVAKLHEFYDI